MKRVTLTVLISSILLFSIFSFAVVSAQSSDCNIWCKIKYLFTGKVAMTGYDVVGIQEVPTCGTSDTAGMTAYWQGEGNANDILGKNNGTLTNGATATAAGKVGANAFGFDGINDYVIFPSSSSWAFGTGNFTVEQWVKWNSLDTWGDRIFFIAKTLPVYGADYWLGLGVQPASGGIMEVWVNGGPTRLTVPFTPTFGTWYHIVVTRGGTDLRIYINGVSAGNVSDANTITPGPFSIGGAQYDVSSPYYLNGIIDEIAVYNRSFSAAEIAAHYSRSNSSQPYCTTAPAGPYCGDGTCNSPTETQSNCCVDCLCPSGQTCTGSAPGTCKINTGQTCSSSSSCASQICCGNQGNTQCAAAKCNSAVGAVKYAPDAAGCAECRDSSGICVPKWSPSSANTQYCVKSGVFGVACDAGQPCNGGQYCNSANVMTSPQLS